MTKTKLKRKRGGTREPIEFRFPMLRYYMNQLRIPKIICGEAKKKKQVVYGSQAMNAQLPWFLRRETSDWDIFTRKAKETAHGMQGRLDRAIVGGRNDFYAKQALHKKTFKVMHEGPDEIQGTRDDFSIVDYTEPVPKKLATVKMENVKLESLASIVKGKKKMLKDPKSKYRHRKDRDDLARIFFAKRTTETPSLLKHKKKGRR